MIFRQKGKMTHALKVKILNIIERLPQANTLTKSQYRQLKFFCDETMQILKDNVWELEVFTEFELTTTESGNFAIVIKLPLKNHRIEKFIKANLYHHTHKEHLVFLRRDLIQYWAMKPEARMKIVDHSSDEEICEKLRWIRLAKLSSDPIEPTVQKINYDTSLLALKFHLNF